MDHDPIANVEAFGCFRNGTQHIRDGWIGIPMKYYINLR